MFINVPANNYDSRPTDNQQFTDRSPTGYQQVADSRQKYSRDKILYWNLCQNQQNLPKSEEQKAKNLPKAENSLS